MGKYGDWLVMLVAVVLIVLLLYRLFYRWLHEPPSMHSEVLLSRAEEVDDEDEHVKLLEEEGFDVTYGRYKVPIHIDIDTGEQLQSRLFIDMIAEKDGKHYIVKTARERMPLEWTGSGLRDKLLVYALLLPEASGVVYVNARERTVRMITFHFPDQ
ncbi:hypothetical protein ACFFSY_05225 [Paenibacillus aurantiacus]|uniref:Uncharacterized protein n=1 Tax=Paenibacillus aurantiacus TaxID=1936118 RepID=A0ABV5KJC5_9BACL